MISLVWYVTFFSLGISPVPWAVNSEIYPQNVRGLANGVATSGIGNELRCVLKSISELDIQLDCFSYVFVLHQFGW